MRAGRLVGCLVAALCSAGCGGGGGEGSNSAPVSRAGPDQWVATGALVTLDGSGSSDADGDSLSYLWSMASKPEGSTATLSSPTAAAPVFTADLDGVYVLSLRVNDGKVDGPPDSVAITATTGNVAPIADAGSDRSVTAGSLVTLDGSGSSDANGDPLTYLWTMASRPDGSTAALSSATAVAPTFTADLDGSYVLMLTVNDGRADSSADSVTITATRANAVPVADAGPDQRVMAFHTASLDGTRSTDADGDPLAYHWALESKPAGSSAALTGAYTVGPTLQTDLPGAYVVSLVVEDGIATSPPDTVTITAVASNWVPDTGQSGSYTAAPGEDSDYSINPPHYTIRGDGTLRDDFTGLVWQQQDDGIARQWDAAAAYCPSLGLPGTGWRLPTPYELLTITNFGRSSPAIDTSIFTGGRAAYYWSGQPFRQTADAWLADFFDGGVVTAPKTTAAYVRCVRDPPTGPVFQENIGTVSDAARGLTWQQADDGTKKTWEQALAYCEGLSLGVWSDWRLPTVKEIASLEDFATYPVANLAYFPTTKQDYYWSSTTVGSAPTTAWQASFLGGGVGSPGLVKASADAYVRCVRGP